MKEIIIGNLKSQNSELLRQYFVINLKRLDELHETPRGKFLKKLLIDDDYISMKNMFLVE